ncbi:MAG: phosphoribosyltransferase, partial [Actinobacteria bacterium]
QAVGQFYRDFDPTTDHDVIACLESMPDVNGGSSDPHDALDSPRPRNLDIEITAGSVVLSGRLVVPEDARGIVVFAHGSGSSRHSPRNRFVASVLNDAGLATLLFDLLTPEEEAVRSNVFDIDLLGQRLATAARHLRHDDDLSKLDMGIFGASTGAAAALYAAAQPGPEVAAVVSRGGRPDLAGDWLPEVNAPTLLIVGDRDYEVLELNRLAQSRMQCSTKLETVPGATHLFEEPGTLAIAADLAAEWFVEHLGRQR